MRSGKDDPGCQQLEQLYKTGQVQFEEIAHHTVGTGASQKKSTLYLAKILSSVGKTPCDLLATPPGNPPGSTCRLIAKGVSEADQIWDIYLMNCHYGPPCAFLERLKT